MAADLISGFLAQSRAEVSLRKSEERFEKMLAAVPDMISIHDPQMHILYSNWQGFAAVDREKRNRLTKCHKLLSIYPGIKCLFMSGYTANVIAHQGVLDKSVNFIQKPFSRRDLGAKIRDVLDQ